DPKTAIGEAKTFVEEYRKQFGKEPNFAAQIGYTGAQIVVKALQNAGKDLTADSLIKGMEQIKDYHDAFGSPPISFGPDKHQGSNESFLCQIKDGHWVQAVDKPLGY
ncbi:MAG: ABC transporter substrate-binding protein, partial [Rhodospirillales bacterium]|nr:ABC transporter substrate-binding protein [Rhodospirillales bacterium]